MDVAKLLCARILAGSDWVPWASSVAVCQSRGGGRSDLAENLGLRASDLSPLALI